MNKYTPNLSSQFENKVIIVTGSTQGSGAETARLLAHRGAKGITICGRKEKEGLEVKEEIEKIGSECIFVKADLSKEKDCRNIVQITDQTFGRVNILSMAMHSGHPFLAAYSASKAALANITKNTANAVAAHNIRVNALNIGWTDTPGEDVIQKKFHGGRDDWLEKAEKKVPFKRLTKPLDVARAAAYFCSDESGLTTGSIIDYDQTVLGWHSYSVYDSNIIDDSLLGE